MDQQKPNKTRAKIFDELMLFFEEVLSPYLDQRFGGVETRLNGVETRLNSVEIRLNSVENRLDRVETRLVSVEEDLDEVKSELKIANRKIDILNETTPNRLEFKDHEKRIAALEKSISA